MSEYLHYQRDREFLLGQTSDLVRASAEEIQALLLSGLILRYQQDASPEAIQILQETAAHSPYPTPAAQAAQALCELSLAHQTSATDALYTLAIHNRQPAAIEHLRQHPEPPTDNHQRKLFELLYLPLREGYSVEQLSTFSAVYATTTPAVQEQIRRAAADKGLADWAQITAAVFPPSGLPLTGLVDQFPSFPPLEREFLLRLLSQVSQEGQKTAQETLCALFLTHADLGARKLACQSGFFPEDLTQRAVFFFLTEQWQAYKDLDFNHSLLISAFRLGTPEFRNRLIRQSRQFGLADWLKSVDAERQSRWIGHFNDTEWDLLLQQLLQSARYADLWRIALHSSPLRCAQILKILQEKGWRPEDFAENEGFERLVTIAQRCLRQPYTFSIPFKLKTHLPDLTCFSISAGDQWIAAGSSGSTLRIWSGAAGYRQFIDCSTPVNAIRALAFSPDQETLACSCGDNRIRVFRLKDAQIIKTLDGHHGLIRALALLPDARQLVSASFDGSIRLWRYPFGPEIGSIPAQNEQFALALHGSDQIISAGAGPTIQVLRASEGAVLNQLEHPADTITHLAVSRQLGTLAAGGRDHQLRIWNNPTGQVVRDLQGGLTPLTGLALHPTEPVAFSASTHTLLIWNLSNGELLSQLSIPEGGITGITLDENGTRLLAGIRTGQIWIWNLETWLLTRLPVENIQPAQITHLHNIKKMDSPSEGEKSWIEFTLEMNQWLRRYEFFIEETFLHVGEFDIQL